jgi:CAAX protease family protein
VARAAHLPLVNPPRSAAIPTTLVDTFIIAYPTKRYRSAWIGIAVHSGQSVVLAVLVFALVV